MSSAKLKLFVIAGPNGVGKTTFARSFLPKAEIMEFLNADLLAAGLTPLHPEDSAFAAGRLLLQRWHELTDQKKSFAFETTLSGRTYATLLKKAHAEGYSISLHFLWLPSVQMCLRRIRNRVKKGGHFVPDVDVRRRYIAGLRNFFEIYLRLADEAYLWEVSKQPIGLISTWQNHVEDIFDQDNYVRIRKQIEEN
jgi:predicted ABC-type ATPase